jgi:hypothetical protein
MGLESDKQKLRRKVFRGMYSDNVTEFILYNNMFNFSEKQEIIKKAREIAMSKGHAKVYWEDLSDAIREWREAKHG